MLQRSRPRRPQLVVILVIAVGGVVIGGCGGGGSSPKQSTIPLCNPGSTPGAPAVVVAGQTGGSLPPLPNPLSDGCARGQAHDIVAAPLFRCTSRMGPSEIQMGPSPTTNLDRVELHRGSGGLCVELQSNAIDSFTTHEDPSMVLQIDFHHAGTPAGRDDPTKDYQVTLWARDAGQAYWLTLYPHPGQALETTVGNVGVAEGNVSLIVAQPRLPNWVLAHGTTWDAHLV